MDICRVLLLLSFGCTLSACDAPVDPTDPSLAKPQQVSVATQTHAFARAARTIVVDDAIEGLGTNQFEYIGRWEHVRNTNDGRTGGTSTRSRWPSAVALLPFEGRRVSLYGVGGPNGGLAMVSIDSSASSKLVNFVRPSKRAHELVYQSALLPAGRHVLAIGVYGRKYVNIDGVEIEPSGVEAIQRRS
jgi:hypothetical protein